MLISPRNSDSPDELGKIEQSQQVGDVAARLVDEPADILLAVAMALDQLAIALGLLDRVQILALDILDQRELGARRSSMSRTIAGIVCSRARCAARQRRSPAMISKPSPAGRSRIGCSTPRSAIESASSSAPPRRNAAAAGSDWAGSARPRSRARRLRDSARLSCSARARPRQAAPRPRPRPCRPSLMPPPRAAAGAPSARAPAGYRLPIPGICRS